MFIHCGTPGENCAVPNPGPKVLIERSETLWRHEPLGEERLTIPIEVMSWKYSNRLEKVTVERI